MFSSTLTTPGSMFAAEEISARMSSVSRDEQNVAGKWKQGMAILEVSPLSIDDLTSMHIKIGRKTVAKIMTNN
ncbi:hypothetical protein GX48_01808 [Paracoccidioides brasiliensis]|nr:hypothetical protein GX48_01808 [Paracoccidioides brasiliensis]